MQNRSQITKEFFELIVYLNMANTETNLKTEIAFDIRNMNFGCYLIGVDHPQFLILCYKKSDKKWQPSEYTPFSNLEDFCSMRFNQGADLNSIVKELRSLQLINS